MSASAEVLLEELRKLPPADQQQIVQRLLSELPKATLTKPFNTVKVEGGTITSAQVAEMLDDE
jgi:hypothetical protein